MIEGEKLGVQSLSGQRLAGLAQLIGARPGTVEAVDQDGMAQETGVHADLVGSARLQGYREFRCLGRVGLLKLKNGDRAACRAFDRGEATPIVWIASVRGRNAKTLLLGHALAKGPIATADAVSGELLGQRMLHLKFFGHHHDSRGVLVETVHNTWPRRVIARQDRQGLGFKPKMVQHRVDQGTAMVAQAGVHHHAGRLRYNEQGFIFMQDFEREVLGEGSSQRGRSGQAHLDEVPLPELLAGLETLSPDLDFTRLEGARQLVTGERMPGHLEGSQKRSISSFTVAVSADLDSQTIFQIRLVSQSRGWPAVDSAGYQMFVFSAAIGLMTRSTMARSKKFLR